MIGYRFHTGRFHLEGYIEEEEYQRMKRNQKNTPQPLMKDSPSGKRWWWFQGSFYCEDEGLDAQEVKALILSRLQKQKKRVERAIVELETSENTISPKRQPIPDNIKMFVWQRDRGRCVKCGSQKNLEFDHIIPLSKGGSNSARNTQLLCEECNRSKGGDLT